MHYLPHAFATLMIMLFALGVATAAFAPPL